MNLHARAARVGKNNFHPFALEGLDENIPAQHRRADLGTPGGGRGLEARGRRGFLFSRICGLVHVFVRLAAGVAGQQKTHDRCQPWVLVRVSSFQQAPTASATTTTTTSLTACETFFNIATSLYRNSFRGQAFFWPGEGCRIPATSSKWSGLSTVAVFLWKRHF